MVGKTSKKVPVTHGPSLLDFLSKVSICICFLQINLNVKNGLLYCLKLGWHSYGFFKVCTIKQIYIFHLSVSKGRKFKLRHHFEIKSLKMREPFSKIYCTLMRVRLVFFIKPFFR